MKLLHNLATSSQLLAGYAVVLGLTVLLGLMTLSRKYGHPSTATCHMPV